eukprot:scaffold14064_cov177-Amphora_coffeaeformis.AAC.3
MQASLSHHGGSRAAKKRAKKKHNKQQQPPPGFEEDEVPTKPNKKPRVDKPSKGLEEPIVKVKKENKSTVVSLQEPKVPTENILHFLHPSSSVPASVQDTLEGLTAKQRARAALAFILQPANISVEEFHQKYWEKKPLLVQASSSAHRHRLDGLLSLESIRQMLHDHPMAYGKDLNVTKYTMDPATGLQRRLTLDRLPEKNSDDENGGDGDAESEEKEFIVARPGEVWKQFNDGCTLRLLCPHQHADSVQALLSLLEVEWGCMVGANAYLTPPNASQGFAPHYDDIEAFCLQLSGRKRWKVYPPLPGEKLPRVSSRDYTTEDLEEVEPVMDIVLSPGDLLYMPRGWIHQACTLEGGISRSKDDGHSLHLTVSAMQQWAWVDLLEVLLPEALTAAANSEASTALREGLPRNFLDYMGAIHDDSKESEVLKMVRKDDSSDTGEAVEVKAAQEAFRAEAKNRIMRVAKEAMEMLDAACDQMGKQFITSCQPPALTPTEKRTTSLAQTKAVKILPDMMVRLLRPGIARLVLEDGMAVVYHCMDNSRIYHEKPVSPMEFETDDAPAIEQLLKTLEPRWICVTDLYHDTIEDKIGVVQALYDEGILALRE